MALQPFTQHLVRDVALLLLRRESLATHPATVAAPRNEGVEGFDQQHYLIASKAGGVCVHGPSLRRRRADSKRLASLRRLMRLTLLRDIVGYGAVSVGPLGTASGHR